MRTRSRVERARRWMRWRARGRRAMGVNGRGSAPICRRQHMIRCTFGTDRPIWRQAQSRPLQRRHTSCSRYRYRQRGSQFGHAHHDRPKQSCTTRRNFPSTKKVTSCHGAATAAPFRELFHGRMMSSSFISRAPLAPFNYASKTRVTSLLVSMSRTVNDTPSCCYCRSSSRET